VRHFHFGGRLSAHSTTGNRAAPAAASLSDLCEGAALCALARRRQQATEQHQAQAKVLRWQPTGGEHLLIGFACVRGQLFERVNSSRDLDRLGELVRLDVTRASKVTVLSDIASTSLEQG
jgi:hypothetical protein